MEPTESRTTQKSKPDTVRRAGETVPTPAPDALLRLDSSPEGQGPDFGIDIDINGGGKQKKTTNKKQKDEGNPVD